MDRWWSGCFRDEGERKEVGEILKGRGECGEGEWGWEEFEKWMEKRKQEGKVGYTGRSGEGTTNNASKHVPDGLEDRTDRALNLVDELSDLQLGKSRKEIRHEGGITSNDDGVRENSPTSTGTA